MKHTLILLLSTLGLAGWLHAQTLHHFYPNVHVARTFDSLGHEMKDPFSGGLKFPVFTGADLNGDFNTDLVVLDRSDNRILTFLNTGHGDTIEFTYQPEFEHLFPDTLQSFIIMKDFNGDKKLDIFTYSGSMGAGIAVYKNIGSDISDFRFKLESPQLESYFYGNYQWPVNLPMYTVDMPAIVDVDGDGDVDILTFDPLGGAYLHLYNNFCVEHYGNSDSLLFSSIDEYYGYFFESESSRSITLHNIPPVWLGKYKNYNQDYSQYHGVEGSGGDNGSFNLRATRHAGSTVFASDMDNDGDLDLLIGDVGYPGIAFLENGKTDYHTAIDTMIDVKYNYPPDHPVQIRQMPAVFYIDVDRDHIKDMIFSPVDNSFIDTFQTTRQVWLYRNKGGNTAPNPGFVTDRFLTSDMIYLGGATQPAFFDYDGDGDKDLLVVTSGDFSVTFDQADRIVLFENTGTVDSAAYRLANNDYLGFYNQKIARLSITLGDYDQDGDKDLVTGNKAGKIKFYRNTAGQGNEAAFIPDTIQVADVQGGFASPAMADLDHDSLVDLVIGGFWGRISYFKNTGNLSAPEFTLVTDTLGGFYIDGGNHYTSPAIADLDTNGHPDLVVGYQVWRKSAGMHLGKLAFFKDIDLNLAGKFRNIDTLLYDSVNKLTISRSLGLKLKPAIGLVDRDSLPDIMLGSERGGLMFFGTFFDTARISSVPKIINREYSISVFPNPCSENLNVSIGNGVNSLTEIDIFDVFGKKVSSAKIHDRFVRLNTTGLASGYYILRISDRKGNRISKPIIKK